MYFVALWSALWQAYFVESALWIFFFFFFTGKLHWWTIVCATAWSFCWFSVTVIPSVCVTWHIVYVIFILQKAIFVSRVSLCFHTQAEQELRMTQSEFDRQAEITRLLLEGVSSTHVCNQTLNRTTDIFNGNWMFSAQLQCLGMYILI